MAGPGVELPGRRPSESFIPVPVPRKGRRQQDLGLDLGERREPNDLINEIRYQVDLWRRRGHPGVTPITRKLLTHWADPERENRVMFCQREAAETAIFLTETAGSHGFPDFGRRLAEENAVHNAGLPRIGLKMATGSGKTVVVAMLIAWQTINKVYSPRSAKFSKRFLVVTPGITIRDRLRVILPNDAENYYRQRDLVPGDLWGALVEAQIIIANYHAFLPRTAKEMQGVSATTRKILTYGKSVDPFVESDDQIVSRVLRSFGGRAGPWVVSDFSLMDAIESGIVKVPRIPVDDDATSNLVTYLRLWDHVGTRLPKRKRSSPEPWVMPDTLEGALRSLYRSYAAAHRRWEETLAPLGEPPPVMIVVCSNTVVSKLIFDWIAGCDVETEADDSDGAPLTRAPQPGRRRRQPDRRGPAAGGHEHGGQAGPPG